MDFTTWIDADTESGHSYYEDLSVRPAAGRTDWLSADVKGAVSDFTRMHDEFYRDMAARRLAHLGIPQDVARQGLDAVRAYIIERDHDDALTESARREMERGMDTGRADREADDDARTAREAAERITESEHIMRTYTTDAGIRDMVTEALEASQVAADFDIDAITEFLEARYDEEEEVVTRWDIALYEDNQGVPAWIINARGLVSPEHSLADIEAKRAIVALHGVKETVWTKADGMAPFIERNCTSCGETHWSGGSGLEPADWPCPTLLALAQPFRDHPDFDPEWRLSNGS